MNWIINTVLLGGLMLVALLIAAIAVFTCYRYWDGIGFGVATLCCIAVACFILGLVVRGIYRMHEIITAQPVNTYDGDIG
jgi:hypothetical protein